MNRRYKKFGGEVCSEDTVQYEFLINFGSLM